MPSPLRPRWPVLDAYWRLAHERQQVFYRRLRGDPPPWTEDPVIAGNRFCNAFRASDRFSQFLIACAAYPEGCSTTVRDVFFRIVLARLFNREQTYRRLADECDGTPSAEAFDVDAYSSVLDRLAAIGPVFGAAYMIPPAGGWGPLPKHRRYLAMLEGMLDMRLAERTAAARSLREVYRLLLTVRGVGEFLAYQLATDLNYGPHVDHDEDSFTKAGPGAVRGIAACFEDVGGRTPEDVILEMVDQQEAHLGRLGIDPEEVYLFGRRLHAIDCQNLFCETDKYARVAFPNLPGRGRTQIKQRYSPAKAGPPVDYFFPPKWGINDAVAMGVR